MTDDNQQSGEYIPHVDGLRAVAVISVLLFHLHVPGFAGGYVGVDVFLVISGFLISRLILGELERTGRFSFRNFYARRVRRIMPALLVTLATSAGIMALILSPMYLEQFGGSLLAACFGVSNIFFWLEADYFATASQYKPLLHTWSLGVEEQFYLFWPLFLVGIYQLKARRGLPVLVLALGAVSLWLNRPFSDGNINALTEHAPRLAAYFTDGKSALFFLLPFRIFEFAIGGIMVWGVQRLPRGRVLHDLAFLVGAAMIVWSVVTFDENMLFPMAAALVPCGGAALLIASGGRSRLALLLTNRPMVFVGLISYSLYLVHWPLIVGWHYLFGIPGMTAMIGLIALSVVLAWASWRFVEKPFRRPGFWTVHASTFVAVPLAFTVLAATGWSMQRYGGWPFRVTSTLGGIDTSSDSAAYQRIFYGGAGYPGNGGVDTDRPADLVLMGDSHGRQYAEGLFEEFARPRRLSMYVSAGTSCFHLPGFTRKTVGIDWNHRAPQALERALTIIHDAKIPPVVVISHAWLWQMEVGGLLDDAGLPEQEGITEDDVIDGLMRLKEAIGDAPLVVIGQVPTTNGSNLFDIFTRPDLVQRFVTDPKDYLFTTPRPQYVAFNTRLRQVAEESGTFSFIDPFDTMCGNDGCHNLDDRKRLLYSDTTHLSKAGSRFVIRESLPLFDAVLAARSAAQLSSHTGVSTSD